MLSPSARGNALRHMRCARLLGLEGLSQWISLVCGVIAFLTSPAARGAKEDTPHARPACSVRTPHPSPEPVVDHTLPVLHATSASPTIRTLHESDSLAVAASAPNGKLDDARLLGTRVLVPPPLLPQNAPRHAGSFEIA